MALLFIEGFDHHGNGKELALTGKWAPNGAGNHTVTNSQWRTGGYSSQGYYSGAGDEAVTNPLPVSGNGFVVGVAIRTRTAASSSKDFLRIKEGAVVHLALALTTGMVLQVKQGATVIATGTSVLPINSWVYIEFKGTIHDTTGAYEVRIDTVNEAALTATGVDTRNGGTGQWDRFALTPAVGAWDSWADDIYVCDQSGTACNDFLGPIRIETLFPQPGNGTNVGLAPSTGTDHGAMVDEIPPNTTDYNTGTVVGAKDTYNLPSLVGIGDVIGLQVNLYVAKTDAGARQVCGVVRTGGVDYDGPSRTLLTTFAYVTALWPMNPATGAPWTPAEITALEAGMKVTV